MGDSVAYKPKRSKPAKADLPADATEPADPPVVHVEDAASESVEVRGRTTKSAITIGGATGAAGAGGATAAADTSADKHVRRGSGVAQTNDTQNSFPKETPSGKPQLYVHDIHLLLAQINKGYGGILHSFTISLGLSSL